MLDAQALTLGALAQMNLDDRHSVWGSLKVARSTAARPNVGAYPDVHWQLSSSDQ